VASHQKVITLKGCNLRKCALLALAASPLLHRRCGAACAPPRATPSSCPGAAPAGTAVRCERGAWIPQLHYARQARRRAASASGREAALLVGGDALPLAGVVVAAREGVAVGVVAGVERVHVVADLNRRIAASGTVCRRARRGISTCSRRRKQLSSWHRALPKRVTWDQLRKHSGRRFGQQQV